MSKPRIDSLISNLCVEIDELRGELEIAHAETEHWKSKHAELVQNDIKHGGEMMAGVLQLALTRKVSPIGLDAPR